MLETPHHYVAIADDSLNHTISSSLTNQTSLNPRIKNRLEMFSVAKAPMPVVVCSQKKKRRSVPPKKQIKEAIKQAQTLCYNHEDTIECRIAWDLVEELSAAYRDYEFFRDDDEPDSLSERAKKDYDV